MWGNWTARPQLDGNNISIFVSKLTPGGDMGVGFAILTVVLLSLLGNGLVLAISYRRRKKMAGPELLCVNLAVNDFLSCILFYPLSILSSFSHSWLGCQLTCTYYGLGCFTFGLCGMFTIAAISVTRYLKTCYHLPYVLLEGASMRLVCCGSWLVAAGWSCFPLLGWGEYVPEPHGLSCTVAWKRYHASVKDAAYVICSFACFTFVPVVLIVASQCRILLTVYRVSSALSTRGIHTHLRNAERRLSVMFFCISLGFIVAWAPYAVVSFLSIFGGDDGRMAPAGYVFPALFAKSSHVYNPFIYFYFNKVFRRELWGLLRALGPLGRRNRVGVRPPPGPWTQHPIQIQLQEHGLVQEARCPSSLGGSWRPHGLPVHSCWVSKIRVSPVNADPAPPREFLPMSA
ncbi:opsin 8, group member c [Anguilla anguilla]|uniref:opsin 8, group member c n=1 Tax=Anguilla anguilla TaxID=7936 RepID=UPI0015A827AB|nr:opsin 8, group member c [Anguilla anguilla]